MPSLHSLHFCSILFDIFFYPASGGTRSEKKDQEGGRNQWVPPFSTSGSETANTSLRTGKEQKCTLICDCFIHFYGRILLLLSLSLYIYLISPDFFTSNIDTFRFLRHLNTSSPGWCWPPSRSSRWVILICIDEIERN